MTKCSLPAVSNGSVNCIGRGDVATGLFLLFESTINLNEVTAVELALIPKLQNKVAAAIIQKREALGFFSSYDQIDEVKGIGPKTLEAIKHYTVLSQNEANQKADAATN